VFATPAPDAHTKKLTTPWQVVAVVTWSGVIFGVTASAITGRTVGKPPWWLGPSVNPAPVFFVLLVAVVVIAPLALAISRSRYTPVAGIVSSCAIAVIALLDLADSPGVATVELAVAIAGLLGSLAVFAGVE